MQKQCFRVFLLIYLLVVGCSSISTPTETNRTATVQPIQTIAPSSTPAPTATMEPTSTSPVVLLTKQCLNVSSAHSWDDSFAGTLILASPKNLRENYFLDMRFGKKIPFTKHEDDLAGDFVVSPNRNWLAYSGHESNATEDMLIIQSADGQKRFTYPVNYKEWQIIASWLDNETLILWNHASPLDNIILFNPFTGHKQPMGLEYPNMLPEDNYGWDFSWPSITIYDPSLQYLVYLATGKDGYKPGYATLVLWDRNANHSVTEVNDLGLTVVIPLWKSDGRGLVYVKSETGINPPQKADELFFLSLDGKNEQLTQLDNYFQKAIIRSYSWSPDERFIAVDLQTISAGEQEPKSYMVILDVSTREITDYCLTPTEFTYLIWSPDGHQLAFSEYVSEEKSRTVVIDLEKQVAFVVAENLEPAGWLRTTK